MHTLLEQARFPIIPFPSKPWPLLDILNAPSIPESLKHQGKNVLALGTQSIHLNVIHSKECQSPIKSWEADEMRLKH